MLINVLDELLTLLDSYSIAHPDLYYLSRLIAAELIIANVGNCYELTK